MVIDNGMEYWRMVDGGRFTARGRVDGGAAAVPRNAGVIISCGSVVRVQRDQHQRINTIIAGNGHVRLERVRDGALFKHVLAELTNVIADDDSEVRVIIAELKRMSGFDTAAARVIARALHMRYKSRGDTARAVCRMLDKLHESAGDEGDDAVPIVIAGREPLRRLTDSFEDGIVALLGGEL